MQNKKQNLEKELLVEKKRNDEIENKYEKFLEEKNQIIKNTEEKLEKLENTINNVSKLIDKKYLEMLVLKQYVHKQENYTKVNFLT